MRRSSASFKKDECSEGTKAQGRGRGGKSIDAITYKAEQIFR